MIQRIVAGVLTLMLLLALDAGHLLHAAVGMNIQGTVRDAQTGEPLPGSNVVLVGTSFGASSDKNGNYQIANVPPGAYTIRATYIGYRKAEAPLEVAEPGPVKHDFTLDPVGIEGETVVVTAQAMGQNEAINRQLAATQITNVVSSARIQELPDANAAESVGRLPGISILRSGGEGNQVVVRGLAPKYNMVLVDGVRLASSTPFDRSTDLSMISSNMLDGIEVTKAVTADQDADVIGGTVNFKMRSARGGEREGLGFGLLAQAGYNGLSNAPTKYNNYKYIASAEGRFFEERFGVFAQADIERRNLTSNEFGASYDQRGGSHVDYNTLGLNLNHIPRDRQRANGTVVLDYLLSEGKVSFTNFLSTGTTRIQNRGESFLISNNWHVYSLGSSQSTLNMLTNALEIEHQLPFVLANLKLSHTYAETKNPDDWTVSFQQTSAGLNQFVNVANLHPRDIPVAANNNLGATALNTVITNSSFSRERALTASLDLEVPVTFTDMISSRFKVGGKFRHQKRSYDYDQYDGQGLSIQSGAFVDRLIASHFPSTAAYINTTTIPITCFTDPGFSYGKFLGGDYTMGAPLDYGLLASMAQLLKDNRGYISANNGDIAYGHDNLLSTTNNYAGNEYLSALYVMGTFNIGPDITLIPGVRYQNLKTRYSASRGIQSALSFYDYRHYDTTVTVSHGYWLPDVILRYKPLSWFDIRLSYTNTVAYPDYNQIVPRIDVATTGAIEWNNHLLEPSRSKNYDAYISFYDNTIGLFTVGGFLKQIDNLIYPWFFYVSGRSALPYFPPGLAANQNPQGVYKVLTYVNDPFRIDNWGIELDWQTHFWYLPSPLEGLVMNVNYTHIFSKARYPYTDTRRVGRQITYVDTSFTDRLLYQPNDIVNLSLGYDYKGFSLRVSLLYQADIFTGPNYWEQLRTSTSAYRRWDLSAKQELPWFGLQLFGNINNMNGAYDVSVIQASTGVPQSQQSYGLTADLGLRWQF